jgi:pimeloyl-ACP methyl ester carboxylesterase
MGGMTSRRSATIATPVNTWGLTELIALNVAPTDGVLDQRPFTILPLMALTTFMTGPLLSLIEKHRARRDRPPRVCRAADSEPVDDRPISFMESTLVTYGKWGDHTLLYAATNGIRIAYDRTGEGEPVLLIMGTSASRNVWSMYQVPALNEAGYQAITFDNRGVPPSDVPPGLYSLSDMVADTEGLIDALSIGPCRIIGTSMGGMVAQELAARRPDLVTCCVLIATRARADAARQALSTADRELARRGIEMPASYDAPTSVFQMFSPATLNDDAAVSTWLDIYELSAGRRHMAAGQAGLDLVSDRRDTLRRITVPCRVIAFSDDLICPPHLCAEVADAIPDCDFVEVSSCGHLGYLERPDAVNSSVIEFLDKN